METLFDVAFGMTSAYVTLGFGFAGLVLLLIGGLLLYDALRWPLWAARVEGRIKGVQVSGKFNPAKAAEPVPEPVVPPQPTESFWQAFKKDPAAGALALLFAGVILGVPLTFIGFGGWKLYEYAHLKTVGIEVPAEIVDFEYRSSDDGATYAPVVSFKDRNGEEHRLADRISSSHKFFDKGEDVTVYYEPGRPDHFIIDAFWHSVLLPVVFILMGGGVLAFLFYGGRLKKKKEPVPGAAAKPDYSGEMYTTVYEYRGPDGEPVEARDGSSSGLLAHRVAGKPVRLYVFPEDPQEVRDRGSYSTLAFALIFLAPGLLFLGLAVSRLEAGLYTAIALAGIGGFLLFKLSRIVKPRSEWLSPAEWKAQRPARRAAKRGPPGPLLSVPEFAGRVRWHDRRFIWHVPVLVLIGGGLLAFGWSQAQDTLGLERAGARAEGTVIALIRSRSGDSDSYYPRIEFRDGQGRRHTFKGAFGGNPSLYEKGDTVTVLYDPASPDRALVDLGWLNWVIPGGMGLAGLLCLRWALKLFAGIRRRGRA